MITGHVRLALAASAVILSGCSVGLGFAVSLPLGRRPAAPVYAVEQGETQHGTAGYYGRRSHGRPMSSGALHDMYALTAAHRTLPFGTRVRVRRLDGSGTVTVTINDRRVPRSRVILLSYAAAKALGMIRNGTAPVALKVLE